LSPKAFDLVEADAIFTGLVFGVLAVSVVLLRPSILFSVFLILI
jgi:hypothetical protein